MNKFDDEEDSSNSDVDLLKKKDYISDKDQTYDDQNGKLIRRDKSKKQKVPTIVIQKSKSPHDSSASHSRSALSERGSKRRSTLKIPKKVDFDQNDRIYSYRNKTVKSIENNKLKEDTKEKHLNTEVKQNLEVSEKSKSKSILSFSRSKSGSNNKSKISRSSKQRSKTSVPTKSVKTIDNYSNIFEEDLDIPGYQDFKIDKSLQ